MRQHSPPRRARCVRFVVAIAAAASLLAAAVGACTNLVPLTLCNVPTLDEKSGDGGPDPCHCDPPDSLNITACSCLSDPTDQQAIDEYQACITLVHAEQDAGADGGP